MKIELHILQNFAPANLNRDDTGAPKDCEFGGYRRARVSSQCLKRSIRVEFERTRSTDTTTKRTKRLQGHVAAAIMGARQETSEADAMAAAKLLIEGAGLKIDDDAKTQYLLFLPERAIAALADIAVSNWAMIAEGLTAEEPDEPKEPSATPKKSTAKDKKAQKQKAKDALPADLRPAVKAVFDDAANAPALALFGRMIADKPEWNVGAACQVAHALSTNRVSMEFDYYTAVDDLKPEDNAGSDMIGTVQFNSSCFYRYSVVDVERLRANLGAGELLASTVADFVWASIKAIPSGKQNSMAAQNPPSLVMVVARDGAPVSLANAFVKPVRPAGEVDLIAGSQRALQQYWAKIGAVYGDQPAVAVWADRAMDEAWAHGEVVQSTKDLVAWVRQKVPGGAS